MARAGSIAFGAVHLVLAYLAVRLAVGEKEDSTSTTGAVRQIAEQPFGEVMVWLVAVGMVLLVIWQGLAAAVGYRERDGFARVRKRATAAGKAVVYAVIAYTAAKVAVGSGGSGGDTDSMTARLMDRPGGQVLVGLVGVAIVSVGVGLVVVAYRESYLRRIDTEGMSGGSGTAIRLLGRVGHVAKGVALGAVGALFLYAAVSHEPQESGGLDEALQTVVRAPFGPVLLVLVAAGFAAYGVFCLLQARYLDR